ncbi:MAG: M4 family metallopeptidase [Clostridia bacterium]|nr:M4 family metallopeptidase [Clostridia bacterium]
MSKKTKLIAFFVALIVIIEAEGLWLAIGNYKLKKKYADKSDKEAVSLSEDGEDGEDSLNDPYELSEVKKVTWKNAESTFHYTSPKMIYRNGVPCYINRNMEITNVYTGYNVVSALNDLSDLYGFENAEDEFHVIASNSNSTTNMDYYTVQQKYNGYDVYGHQLIVAVNGEDYRVQSVRGDYYPNITLSQTEIDKDAVIKQYTDANQCQIVASDAVIYIFDNQPQLVVKMITTEGNQSYLVFVNEAGTVVAKEAMISGLGEEQPDGDFTYTDGNNTYTVNVKKAADEEHYYFYDAQRKIYVISNSFFAPETAFTTDEEMLKQCWGMIEIPGWYFLNMGANLFKQTGTFDFTDNGNGVYEIPSHTEEYAALAVGKNTILLRNFEDLYDYYLNNFNYKGPYGSDTPVYIGNRAIVTDGSDYANTAFYSGCNVFLIGDEFTDSTDVCAHEWNHACFYSIVGDTIGRYTDSIDEAYSDIAGVCYDNDDWELGENSGTVVRDISNPNANKQPTEVGGEFFVEDTAAEYDEHINSSIISYSAYLMYQDGAFASKDEMFQIFFNSMYYLTPTSNFEDCAYAVIDSARDFGLSDNKIEIIIRAFITTKVLSEDCSFAGSVVDDTTGEPLSGVYVSLKNTEGDSGYALTDESGKFELYVRNTVIGELNILNPGYEKLTVTVDSNTTGGEVYRLKPATNQQDIEIVFVMDNSASMFTSDPGDNRKTIISSMLVLMSENGLHMSDGLVTFTAASNTVTKTLNNSDDKNASILNLYQIVTDDGNSINSGTCGAEGLKAGLELFSEEPETGRYIVFLSDGEDNRDGTLSYDEIIGICNEKNIHIFSIGLGSGSLDEVILENLALSTDGDCFYAKDSRELSGIVQSIFYNLR